MIDHKKTREAFDRAGFSQAGVARRITTKKLTITPSLFNQVVRGTYHFMQSDRALRVIDELRKLGVLVEK